MNICSVVGKTMTRPRIGIRKAQDHAAELADLFRLLGDTTRLRIALECTAARRPVNAIAERLDLSASLVSHHLRLLKAARIVRSERQGKQVYYSAADDHITRVVTDMLEHVREPRHDDP
jgi:DNA-binding transcriptional ArsR family regulator